MDKMTQYIGLDVGGTKIEGILVDNKSKVIKRVRRPTESWKSRESIISNIVDVAKQLRGKTSFPIGISMAGYKNNYGMPNIPKLIGVKMETVLGKKLKTKVVIANDGHCFALAEHILGVGKGSENLVGVTLGTGIGGGVVIDNRLCEGMYGGAAHIGHMILDPSNKIQCRCGQYGDFESWCAGPHIVKRYVKQGGKIKKPDVAKIFASKEKTARKVTEETYQKLGMGFVNLINLFNPEIIVVGGGLSSLVDYRRIMKETKRYATTGLEKNVKITENKLGSAAGVYGAALLVH